MSHQFVGYHGTSLDSSEKIIEENYKLSIGDKEWLGDGVYFFMKGLNDPKDLARKWAIASAWNNGTKTNKYNEYSVLESDIKVDDDNLLDLTQAAGIEVFEYLIEKFVDKINGTGRRMVIVDSEIINLARKEGIVPIDVVKGNLYFRFAKERKLGINSRIPNSTICTVFDPLKNILDTSIIENGKVI
jgi:hypothetical protein